MFELNVWENRPIDPHFFNPNQDAIAPTSPLEIKTASSQPTQLLGSADVSQQLPDTLETQFLEDEERSISSPEAEMVSNSFKGFSGSLSSVYRSRDHNTGKKLGRLAKEESTNSQNNDDLTGILANFSTQSVSPDVIISNLWAPTIIEAGQSTRIEYTITNQGNGDVDNWSQTKFYLSSDTTLDATDIYLTSDYNYDWSLSAGGSSSEVASFTLNQTLDLDNYYLLAQVDANNEINESNETNNLAYQQITIGEPDLIISNLSAPTTIEAGQSTRI
ncbi:MAG: CARDB domain-containing protein, partial [Crocosphaera sp.]